MKESDILKSVKEFLQYHPKVGYAWRNNTGAMTIGEGKQKRFVRFGEPGIPDILGFMKDGRFLAIECKMPRKKLTDYQFSFIERVKKCGGIAGMVCSVDEVKKLIDG